MSLTATTMQKYQTAWDSKKHNSHQISDDIGPQKRYYKIDAVFDGSRDVKKFFRLISARWRAWGINIINIAINWWATSRGGLNKAIKRHTINFDASKEYITFFCRNSRGTQWLCLIYGQKSTSKPVCFIFFLLLMYFYVCTMMCFDYKG